MNACLLFGFENCEHAELLKQYQFTDIIQIMTISIKVIASERTGGSEYWSSKLE
jgi:hypothetical protein